MGDNGTAASATALDALYLQDTENNRWDILSTMASLDFHHYCDFILDLAERSPDAKARNMSIRSLFGRKCPDAARTRVAILGGLHDADAAVRNSTMRSLAGYLAFADPGKLSAARREELVRSFSSGLNSGTAHQFFVEYELSLVIKIHDLQTLRLLRVLLLDDDGWIYNKETFLRQLDAAINTFSAPAAE